MPPSWPPKVPLSLPICDAGNFSRPQSKQRWSASGGKLLLPRCKIKSYLSDFCYVLGSDADHVSQQQLSMPPRFSDESVEVRSAKLKQCYYGCVHIEAVHRREFNPTSLPASRLPLPKEGPELWDQKRLKLLLLSLYENVFCKRNGLLMPLLGPHELCRLNAPRQPGNTSIRSLGD